MFLCINIDWSIVIAVISGITAIISAFYAYKAYHRYPKCRFITDQSDGPSINIILIGDYAENITITPYPNTSANKNNIHFQPQIISRYLNLKDNVFISSMPINTLISISKPLVNEQYTIEYYDKFGVCYSQKFNIDDSNKLELTQRKRTK